MLHAHCTVETQPPPATVPQHVCCLRRNHSTCATRQSGFTAPMQGTASRTWWPRHSPWSSNAGNVSASSSTSAAAEGCPPAAAWASKLARMSAPRLRWAALVDQGAVLALLPPAVAAGCSRDCPQPHQASKGCALQQLCSFSGSAAKLVTCPHFVEHLPKLVGVLSTAVPTMLQQLLQLPPYLSLPGSAPSRSAPPAACWCMHPAGPAASAPPPAARAPPRPLEGKQCSKRGEALQAGRGKGLVGQQQPRK